MPDTIAATRITVAADEEIQGCRFRTAKRPESDADCFRAFRAFEESCFVCAAAAGTGPDFGRPRLVHEAGRRLESSLTAGVVVAVASLPRCSRFRSARKSEAV